MYDRWGGNLREWKYGDNCDTERQTDKRTDEIRETWAKLFMPHSLIK